MGGAACARHIWQAPNVLVISVARNFNGAKQETGVVTFPEDFEFSPWLHPDSPEHQVPGGTMYECVGMAGHAGTTRGGHYIAHCRDGMGEGKLPNSALT